MKRIILALFVLIVLFGGFFVLTRNNIALSPVKAVKFTAKGFIPERLVVKEGDTVTFSTDTGKDFWPASDPHPTHNIYSGFDPRMPIEATSTWSFVFDKPGVWKYHNHLASVFTGEIVVLTKDGKFVDEKCTASSETPKCFESEIEGTLKSRGLDAALDEMAKLYEKSPVFRDACHGEAHILGAAAYDLFAAGKLDALSPKTSYCGYGFYHGFMEKLLQLTGRIDEAQAFCKKVGELLAPYTSDAEGACYHGIGHGSVDGGDPTVWGDPEAMIAPSIKLCEKVAPINDYQGKRFRCTTGVFNAIEILSQNPQYKLDAITKDPFYLCPKQPIEYQEGCYTNMIPALLRKTKNSFEEAAKAIIRIPQGTKDWPIRPTVLESLAHEYVRAHINDTNLYGETASFCRTMPENLRLTCFGGIGGGLMKYGEPEKEYVRAFAFCGSDLLKSDEQDACYGFVLPRLRIWYPAEKAVALCKSVGEKYTRYCQGFSN